MGYYRKRNATYASQIGPKRPKYAPSAKGFGGRMGPKSWAVARELYKAGKYAATGNYVGAALDYGGRVVKYAARRVFKRKAAAKAVTQRYHTSGGYHGRFRKGKRGLTPVSIYANKGVLLTSEVNGTVSDPDCIYITHVACDTYKLIIESVNALFRKLFEKAGFNVTTLDMTVSHTALGNASDWTVQLTEQAGQTGIETVNTNYVTVAASTVRSVASQFYGTFLSYSAGQTFTGSGAAATDSRLYRLILFSQDYNTTLAPVFHTSINLYDEMMHLYACSELKIQNRTLAADSSADAEDVSNNPLVGRTYGFPGIPKVRSASGYPLNAIPINQGVQLVRAATISPNNPGWKEPPDPTVFTNCRKSIKVRLEPGAIKSSKIVYRKSMNFIEFLRKVNIQYGVTPGFHVYHSIFPSEVFALEDLINVNPTHNISCAYEANQMIGVWLQTKKKATGLTDYSTSTFSNNPA